MIIRTLTWKKFMPHKLVSYINDHEKQQGKSHALFWNTPFPNERGFIEALKQNDQLLNLRSNSNRMLHQILSFSPDNQEDITPDKIRTLAQKYLEIAYPDHLAYGNMHFDTNHPHIHLIVSPNPYKQSKVTHISKKQYREIRYSLEKFQEQTFPELSESIVFLKGRQNNKTKSQKQFELEKRGAKTILKDHLKQLVTQCYEQANAIDDFYDLLLQADNELALYQYRGKTNGITYRGKKYRFSTLGISKDKFYELQNHEQATIQKRLQKLAKLQQNYSQDRSR